MQRDGEPNPSRFTERNRLPYVSSLSNDQGLDLDFSRIRKDEKENTKTITVLFFYGSDRGTRVQPGPSPNYRASRANGVEWTSEVTLYERLIITVDSKQGHYQRIMLELTGKDYIGDGQKDCIKQL